jgi:hypothetical protein
MRRMARRRHGPVEADVRLTMMLDVSAGREQGQTGAATEPIAPLD